MGKKWKLVLPLALLVLLLCTVCASAACSHKWELYDYFPANCISCAQEAMRCTVCGKIVIHDLGTVDPDNHENVVCTRKAVIPTCTAKGRTAEYTCMDCGKIVEASVTIPANGHKMALEQFFPANCIAPAQEAWRCFVCGYGVIRNVGTVDPDNHEVEPISVGTNLLQNTCVLCGKKASYIYINPNASPRSFTAANVSNGIKLTWSAVTNANAGYTIWRGSKLLAGRVKGTTYTDTTAVNGTKYTYKITAEYEGPTADGALSLLSSTNPVSKTYAFVSRPAKVTVSNKTLTVAKVTGAAGYQVQILDSAGKNVYDKTAASNTRTLGLKLGTYKARARAYRTVSGVKYWSAWTGYVTFKLGNYYTGK